MKKYLLIILCFWLTGCGTLNNIGVMRLEPGDVSIRHPDYPKELGGITSNINGIKSFNEIKENDGVIVAVIYEIIFIVDTPFTLVGDLITFIPVAAH